MPGATTASEVFFEAAMERNEVMMPQTVPNRPTKGPAGGGGGEHQQVGFELFDLAGDGDVEHFLDARLQAHEGGAGVLERALPFPHGGDEQRRRGHGRARGQRLIKVFQRIARPEHAFEFVHGRARAAEQHGLLTMIAQHQTEARQQADHHEFDDKLALQNMAKTEPSVAAAASGVAAISFIHAILANSSGASFTRA